MLYRQRKVLWREWRTPAFRSGAPSTRYDFSCHSPSPSSHRTALYAVPAMRLAPRRTRMFVNASHLPQASAMPIPTVHRGQGSQRAKQYGSAGEPFNSQARARTAVCAEWFDPSRGCVRAHTRACRYEQADLGTAAEYLRSRRDPGSICLWRAWLAGPSCSHSTQIPGVRDGGRQA